MSKATNPIKPHEEKGLRPSSPPPVKTKKEGYRHGLQPSSPPPTPAKKTEIVSKKSGYSGVKYPIY